MTTMNNLVVRKTGVNIMEQTEIDLQKLLLEALKELNLKVEALKSRIDALEQRNRNDGK